MIKKPIFRSAIYKWVNVITQTLGINVVFSGSNPYTDGKTIYVFSLPVEITEEFERVIIGAIDHEAAHIHPDFGTFKNPKEWETLVKQIVKKYGSTGKMVFNLFEDNRIERLFTNAFPGAQLYLESLINWCYSDGRMKFSGNTYLDAVLAFGLSRFKQFYKETVSREISEESRFLVDSWYPYREELNQCLTLKDVYLLSIRFLENIFQKLQEENQTGENKEDESEEGEGVEKESGDGSSSSSESCVSEEEKEGESKRRKVLKTRLSEAEIQDKPDEKIEDKTEYKDYSNEKKVEEEYDYTPVSILDQCNGFIETTGYRVVSAGIEDLKKDAKKIYDSEVYEMNSGNAYITKQIDNSALANQIINSCKNLYPQFKRNIKRYLLGDRFRRVKSEVYDGSLDTNLLYLARVKNGPRNLFTTSSISPDINSAVLILIDGSGSMAGGTATQCIKCAYFLSDVFTGFRVALETAVFQQGGSGSCAYVLIKSFEDSFKGAKNRFYPIASGGTPAPEAMYLGVQRLYARNEDRKYLFFITDGSPNNGRGNAPKYMRNLAIMCEKSLGIHVIGLGVNNYSRVSACFPTFQMIDSTSDGEVEKGLIEVIKNSVLRRK